MTENTIDTNNKITDAISNSKYYIDKNISDIIMSYLKPSIIDNKNKNITNVAIAICMLLCADIAKSLVMDFIRNQKKQLCQMLLNNVNPLKIFYYLVDVYRSFCLKPNTYQLTTQIKNDDAIYFNLKYTQQFLSNLIKYIELDDKCTFRKTYSNLISLNGSKICNDSAYSNIIINLDEITININNIFHITDNYKIKCDDGDDDDDDDDDNNDNNNNNNNDNVFDNYMKYALTDCNLSNITLQSGHSSTHVLFRVNDNARFTCKYFMDDAHMSCCDMIFKLCFRKYFNFDDIKKKTISLNTHNAIIIAYHIACKISKLAIGDKILQLYTKYFNSPVCIKDDKYIHFDIPDVVKLIKIDNEHLEKYISDNIDVDINPNTKNKTHAPINKNIKDTANTMKLTINTKLDYYGAISKLKEFVININNQTNLSENNNKINIYTICVENYISQTKLANKEHEKYIEMKQRLLKENDKIEQAKIIELIGIEPQKETIEEKTMKRVNLHKVNEKYCSFDNLYLPKEQDTYLHDLYRSYIEDREHLRSLNIANKLCILLYGPPGTGKTTTIITTASYFGRDIFYVSLKGISNKDLEMIFDYISDKSHSNSGIIIFEDFDAMTDVVLRRKTLDMSYESDCSEFEKDSKSLIDTLSEENNDLTLDYFLNLLDGTLSREGSIIILTTNHIDKIDKAIYRAGRVDATINMQKSDRYQIKKIFKRFMNRDIDENVLNAIEEHKYAPAEIIFRLRDFIKQKQLSDREILLPFISN